MALYKFSFLDKTVIHDDTKISIFNDGAVSLRRKNILGEYDPLGEYEDATIIGENFEASELTTLEGLNVNAEIPTGTSLKYQLSVDNGLNWLRWNGISWVSDAVYNTITEINTGLSFLTFNISQIKQLRIKTEFKTDITKKLTPLLNEITLSYRVYYSYLEDLKFSFWSYLNNFLICPLIWAEQVATSGSTYIINSKYNIKNVYAAYNKTTDPTLVNNILSSFVSPNTVNLTQNLAIDDILYIKYKGSPQVDIGGKDNLFYDNVLPKIIIIGDEGDEQRIFRTSVSEYDYRSKDEKYLKSPQPVHIINYIDIYILDDNEQNVMQVADGIWEALQYTKHFKSKYTGQDFVILDNNVIREVDKVSEAVRMKRFRIKVVGRKIIDDVKEVKALKEINLSLYDSGGNKIIGEKIQ